MIQMHVLRRVMKNPSIGLCGIRIEKLASVRCFLRKRLLRGRLAEDRRPVYEIVREPCSVLLACKSYRSICNRGRSHLRNRGITAKWTYNSLVQRISEYRRASLWVYRPAHASVHMKSRHLWVKAVWVSC